MVSKPITAQPSSRRIIIVLRVTSYIAPVLGTLSPSCGRHVFGYGQSSAFYAHRSSGWAPGSEHAGVEGVEGDALRWRDARYFRQWKSLHSLRKSWSPSPPYWSVRSVEAQCCGHEPGRPDFWSRDAKLQPYGWAARGDCPPACKNIGVFPTRPSSSRTDGDNSYAYPSSTSLTSFFTFFFSRSENATVLRAVEYIGFPFADAFFKKQFFFFIITFDSILTGIRFFFIIFLFCSA